MYFSLLDGSVIIYSIRKISLPSLYENKLGAVWKESKEIEGFSINMELYNDLVINLALHSV